MAARKKALPPLPKPIDCGTADAILKVAPPPAFRCAECGRGCYEASPFGTMGRPGNCELCHTGVLVPLVPVVAADSVTVNWKELASYISERLAVADLATDTDDIEEAIDEARNDCCRAKATVKDTALIARRRLAELLDWFSENQEKPSHKYWSDGSPGDFLYDDLGIEKATAERFDRAISSWARVASGDPDRITELEARCESQEKELESARKCEKAAEDRLETAEADLRERTVALEQARANGAELELEADKLRERIRSVERLSRARAEELELAATERTLNAGRIKVLERMLLEYKALFG